MTNNPLEKRAQTAEACINNIQDFLEYRFSQYSNGESRDAILVMIDSYVKELKTTTNVL